MNEKLVWHCAECGGSVEDGDGYLRITAADTQRYETELSNWQTQHGALRVLDRTDEIQPIRWEAVHDACDMDVWLFHMNIEDVRTPRHIYLMSETLMALTWLSATNWDQIMRNAITGNSDLEAIAWRFNHRAQDRL